MLNRTQKKIKLGFALILILIILFIIEYFINKPIRIPSSNTFLNDISLFQTHGDKNILLVIHWNKELTEESVNKKENFEIKQVIPVNNNWEIKINPKKINIQEIQYVYSAWVDTEEKRSKSSQPHKKVTHLFIKIDPKEEIGDFYKISIKNLKSVDGEILEKIEYAVVKFTKFNALIKR
ncbi:MAG: hypothetical protein U0354_07950 [Candidatus Sericytochromatia bacterium]